MCVFGNEIVLYANANVFGNGIILCKITCVLKKVAIYIYITLQDSSLKI